MSGLPNVLIGVGNNPQPKIPKQKYTNLFTEYNISSLLEVESDAMFFNRIAANNTPDAIPNDIDIYGFMEGAWSYTEENAIQKVVDFFQQDNSIEILICDVLIDKGEYQAPQYISPFTIQNNIPFFVKQSIVNKINFVNQPNFMLNQLQRLQSEHVIFHIAAPLLSLTHREMNE